MKRQCTTTLRTLRLIQTLKFSQRLGMSSSMLLSFAKAIYLGSTAIHYDISCLSNELLSPPSHLSQYKTLVFLNHKGTHILNPSPLHTLLVSVHAVAINIWASSQPASQHVPYPRMSRSLQALCSHSMSLRRSFQMCSWDL